MRKASLLLIIVLLWTPLFAQPDVGSTSPTFFLRTLDGDSFFLSRHVGEEARPEMKQPIVLSFFASWCIPCRAEIPILHSLQEEYPDVKFLLVNVEEKQDLVGQYVEEYNISLPVLMDMYSVVAKKFGVVNEDNIAVLPQLVLIDSDGNLVYHHEGYESGDEEALVTHLENLGTE